MYMMNFIHKLLPSMIAYQIADNFESVISKIKKKLIDLVMFTNTQTKNEIRS